MRHDQQRRRSTLSAEWPVFFAVMLVLAGALGSFNGLGQGDRLIYDWLTRQAQRPAAQNVVIVAIDELSLASLGRWPWPRRHHAQLLHTLHAGGAKVVGLDVILSEEGYLRGDGADDLLLAAALRANKRTVLPVVFERTPFGMDAVRPLPSFDSAAAALGFTHFPLDVDGVVRAVNMREAIAGAWWSQFAVSVFRAGQGDAQAHGTSAPVPTPERTWMQAQAQRIPYAGPPGHFRTLSYVDVLEGKVAPSVFEGKYVLVGATAPGLATAFSTPFSSGLRAMAGVEIQANILAGLLEDAFVQDARPWQSALFSMLAVALAVVANRFLSPVRALVATAGIAVLTIATSWLAFRFALWMAPGAAFVSVLATYPLWNWRRLEATIAFLGDEFARLNHESRVVLGRGQGVIITRQTDYLDRRMTAMQIAAQRARDTQRFVIDSLNSMPDPTLVLSPDGDVILYNRAAEDRLSLDPQAQSPHSLSEVLRNIRAIPEEPDRSTDWHARLLLADVGNRTVEARSTDGHEYLVKAAESRQSDGTSLGWIVSLVDVTPLRTAERTRDESLRFISHDMRAPQASILALLELQKNPATAFSQHEFFARIEKSVQTTLALADDFVHLAKAESAPYHLQEADFPSMLADAADDMWALAKSREVEVDIDADLTDDWVSVDRPLMVRVLGNLISNAIKFSPPGGRVVCHTDTIHRQGRRWVACHVRDKGSGIPYEEQAKIFSPFVRGVRSSRDGVGLGLVFVKTVVERHGGWVFFSSIPGAGTTFTIELPCVGDAREAKNRVPTADAASMEVES